MAADTTPHLWEIDHPYYAPDGYSNECESFAELRHTVNRIDEDMNHIYRWDWTDYAQPQHDDLFLDGEDRSEQVLRLFLVLPRNSLCMEWRCPITHEQQDEVRAWLSGPRVLGALRTLWEPLIPPAPPAGWFIAPDGYRDVTLWRADPDRPEWPVRLGSIWPSGRVELVPEAGRWLLDTVLAGVPRQDGAS